jgi:SAM-dependent methyltransferase
MSEPSPPSRDPTRRFAGRVDAYARSRPGYPDRIVEVLTRHIGLDPSWSVADIGSGTGLSSRPFLMAGQRVLAVEPNPEMRAAAEKAWRGHAGFESVAGTAEATTLPSSSVDLVFAGQAFHWFQPEAARREWARVLRSPRWVALAWNTRRIDDTPFLKAVEALLLGHGTDYASVRHDRAGGAQVERFFEGSLEGHRVLPNEQVLDREGLRQRLLSISYAPAPGEAGHRAMMEALDRVFTEHRDDEGRVRILYDLEFYWGRLSAS